MMELRLAGKNQYNNFFVYWGVLIPFSRHIGDQKLLILEKAINDAQLLADTSAIICVEIGSYCGYSALGIARRLRQNDKLICIECDPNCVKWTKRLLAHADISERVNILQGKIDDQSLNALQVMLHGEAIHLLFIDHDKATYLKDLKLIEDWNLLRHGTIVVADNVLSFGAPLDEYLSHVRNPIGPYRSSTLHMSTVEYANSSDFTDRTDESLIDGVEVSVFA